MENLEKQTILTMESLYDLSMLEEMDDAEYLLEVIDLLLQETPKDLKALQEGIQSGKTDIVYKKAHKLKSSSGVIQAANLTSILEDIETLGKKGIINDELKSLVENAVKEYKDIEKSLKAYAEALR
jgi:HPt (histidine-containing phosphotransfer) domain-containing protein